MLISIIPFIATAVLLHFCLEGFCFFASAFFKKVFCLKYIAHYMSRPDPHHLLFPKLEYTTL